MIVRASVGGVSCYAESHRFLGENGHTILLSLFGPRNAVRACWATFFDRKRWPMVRVGNIPASREEGQPYTTIQTPLGKDLLHTIIIHSGATRQGTAFTQTFFQVGPDAEERFFGRLCHLCPVPMRPAWKQDVWELGLQHKIITSLEGFGLPLYQIHTSSDQWGPVIQTALAEKRIF